MFSRNGSYHGVWLQQYLCKHRAGATIAINFQSVRQAGATMFDLVSDDDMRAVPLVDGLQRAVQSRGRSLLSTAALFGAVSAVDRNRHIVSSQFWLD